jgi:hypothetical protein
MAIGGFLGDQIREIYGEFDTGMTGNSYTYGVFGVYASNKEASARSGSSGWVSRFRASSVVPAGLENRPASISAYVCIKY